MAKSIANDSPYKSLHTWAETCTYTRVCVYTHLDAPLTYPFLAVPQPHPV